MREKIPQRPANPPEPPTAAEPANQKPAAEQPTGALGKPWARAFATAVTVWGIASVIYLIVTLAFYLNRPDRDRGRSFLDIWWRWDSGHYTTIANTGYRADTENTAFFPLYPLLIRLLNPVLPGEQITAGLIISTAACIAALAVLFRLTEDLCGSAIARRTTYLLMAYPAAFYFVAIYTESTFLLFSLGSLYCMRRGRWWAAGALGALASATRQAGVLLALAFAVEYLRQQDWKWRRIRWNALSVGLYPVGLFAYMAYLGWAFGDPFKFASVQTYWGRTTRWPWEGTIAAIDNLARALPEGWSEYVWLMVLDLGATFLFAVLLALCVVGRWRLNRPSAYLVVWALASYLMVLVAPIAMAGPPLHGMPRYALTAAVPAFIVLARMLKKVYWQALYLVPSVALQVVLLLGFFNNQWIS